MIVDGHVWHAEDDSRLINLLDVAFATPRDRGWAANMVARPAREFDTTVIQAADNRLRIAADPTTGWGALNFLQLTSNRRIWQSWNTFNPHLDGDAPQLPFGRSGLVFPYNAALPLQTVRRAILEYSHSTVLPKEVHWQESNYL